MGRRGLAAGAGRPGANRHRVTAPRPGTEEAPRPRVVITGVGVVSALGRTTGQIWDAMVDGRSGVRAITRFDASRFATRIAGEVTDADVRDARFGEAYWDTLDRRSRFAVSAALSAVQGAGLSLTPQNRGFVTVVMASERPEEDTLLAGARLLDHDVDEAARILAAHARPHAPSERVAALLGVTGPVLQLENRAAGGLAAIIEAAAIIRRGDALVAIAGGAEAPITPLTLAAFQGTGALSTRNDDPAGASRPLDLDRDGFVIAEGAAVVVLESLEVAVARGARILAEIEGEALTFSPGTDGVPSTDPVQIGTAIQRALASSGRIQSEIDVVMLHAAGTVAGDRLEALGVRRIFGASTRHHLYTPAVKSHLGHLLAASGPMALAVLLEAMHHQVIPWTRNLEHEDPEVDLDANTRGPRPDNLRVAMVNASGWAHNAVLAICHPDAMRPIPDSLTRDAASEGLGIPPAGVDLP
ncbi:MAG: beta-ketoacyl-[acyl-carrier-protein] synthase family protein [Chloroflexi bacterium]|nr:beta-ketoacyl-[acyl-carrier-protein] synthase family protein [Chloroflexota bacterium]MQC25362.1 beta-ketoacyl-[acyl-carrier-protein] synthase family protein [Chloroflexota bacterium]